MALPWPIPLRPAKGDPLDSPGLWNAGKRYSSIESDPFFALRRKDAEDSMKLEFMEHEHEFCRDYANYNHNLLDLRVLVEDTEPEECRTANLRPQSVTVQVPRLHPERQLQGQHCPLPDIPVVMQPHGAQYPEYTNGHHAYSRSPSAGNSDVDQHPQRQRQQGPFEPDVMSMDSYPAFSTASSACPAQTQAPNHLLSAQASTPFYPSTSSFRTSTPHTGTTYSRPVSSPLSKPFRYLKPNCNKSYKQANGLKYHMTHGSCNFALPKDSEALRALLVEKGVVNGRDRSGGQITEGEMCELEREAERRLRPYACGVGDCQRRYKNMNGLRYHFQHSGDHGAIGLQLLASGQHECFQQSKLASATCFADSTTTSLLSPSLSKPTGSRSLHNPQGFDQPNSRSSSAQEASPTELSDHVRELSTDDPQCVDASSPTLEHVPTSVTLLPVLVPPDDFASDRTRELLADDQHYISSVSGSHTPSQELIPTPRDVPPDKLSSDYVRESFADGKQRDDATSILSSFPQDPLPISSVLVPPDGLTTDPMREILADDQQYITAISTSPSPAQEHISVSPPGPPDNPLFDHMHDLPTDGQQRIIVTSKPPCSTQEHIPTSQSPHLRIPTPPDKLHPTLSCWIKNMNKLSGLIDRLQELASSAPLEHRSQLSRQVVTLRTMYKKQQEHCMEFLQLSEEYADRYLLDISAEIQQQSDFLDKLEERLEAAKRLRGEAVDLQMFYESGTVATMENLRASALSRPLPEDQALFDEVDLVLTEIRRCYAELDKFWAEEISRAIESLKMRRVDPMDFERWKNFNASLKQTIVSWKKELPSDDAQTLHRNNSSNDVDIGVIASSLSFAAGSLTSALDRLPSTNSLKYLQSGRSFIQRVYVAFAANSDLCLSFLRRCADYGEMAFAWCPPFASPTPSYVGVPRDLRERTMRLLSDMTGIFVENTVNAQGSQKFKVTYNKALCVEQKMTFGLNTLLAELSSWVTVTDGHDLPGDALPGVISVEELREPWEKARDSVRAALATLKNEPPPQLYYRSAPRASTRPLSVMKRWLINLVCYS